MTDEFRSSGKYMISLKKDTNGSTSFADEEEVNDSTDSLIQILITEGSQNSWFSKLPSHEQLMKRVRHSFGKLALPNETVASLHRVLMTPKILTLIWVPEVPAAPPLCFDDDSDSDAGTEPELEESSLPPVALKDIASQSQEAYLLSRLRAAKARVEEEQTRMQYFEKTGRMPPDSESDEDEED